MRIDEGRGEEEFFSICWLTLNLSLEKVGTIQRGSLFWELGALLLDTRERGRGRGGANGGVSQSGPC